MSDDDRQKPFDVTDEIATAERNACIEAILAKRDSIVKSPRTEIDSALWDGFTRAVTAIRARTRKG